MDFASNQNSSVLYAQKGVVRDPAVGSKLPAQCLKRLTTPSGLYLGGDIPSFPRRRHKFRGESSLLLHLFSVSGEVCSMEPRSSIALAQSSTAISSSSWNSSGSNAQFSLRPPARYSVYETVAICIPLTNRFNHRNFPTVGSSQDIALVNVEVSLDWPARLF